jgi:uncharacterized membrane protein
VVTVSLRASKKMGGSMSQAHIEDHVKLIARHEEEFLARRTSWERTTDAIAIFIGSAQFIAAHLAIYTVWIVLNTLPQTWHFDPKPFSMLQTVSAMEAILIASLILMRQTRIGRRSDERDHLMLQMLMLSEKETTTLLNVNREIASEVGLAEIANSPEAQSLSEDVSIDDMAQTIREALPKT